MQRSRRALVAWLGLAGLLGALLAPASAFADAFTSWTPGPGAAGDSTYDGFIDVPSAGASVPNGGFTVAGWFVDRAAQGWAGADDVQIWQGTMDGGGTMLAKAVFAQNRPDVANALANPYWAASGFGAVVPVGSLPSGTQVLSVYAHTPAKGWWYKQVQANVSGAAAAAPIPVVSGGALPIVAIEKPASGENVKTANPYTLMGYALDRNAAISQGSQGTGIDSVSIYVDAEKENGGAFLADADLAFSDDVAQAAYGTQFANSGWRATFKPTTLRAGSHTLFVYAHSVVTGKETFQTVGFSIVEG
jgi:Bacterial Ig domain